MASSPRIGVPSVQNIPPGNRISLSFSAPGGGINSIRQSGGGKACTGHAEEFCETGGRRGTIIVGPGQMPPSGKITTPIAPPGRAGTEFVDVPGSGAVQFSEPGAWR